VLHPHSESCFYLYKNDSLKKFLTPFILFPLSFLAQTFDLEQVEQIFRPRIKWDNRYIFSSPVSNTTGSFSDYYSNAVVTFPIRSRLDVGFQLDLTKPNLKDIIKNSVKVHASQTLGSIRLGYRQTNMGFDNPSPKNFYSLTGGFMGVKLDKKFRVVFYNLSVNFSEQDKTLYHAVPRASGVLGRLHIKSLKKNYYYGIAMVYSDGLPLPIPFFGGSQPVGNNFIINYTIPAALNLQYKKGQSSFYIGAMADGFRTGMQYQDKRININHTAGQAYLLWRQKVGRTFAFRLEGGYYFYSVLNLPKNTVPQNRYQVKPGPYVNIGVNVLFGQNFFDKVLEKFKEG
jgi:hypothetical protein